jgi:hypothetical protein
MMPGDDFKGGLNVCFFKEEVYIGYSMADLAKVRSILKQEGIKYSYDVQSMLDRGGPRGHHGSMGINMDYEKQYTVSVKRKDYEKASYLVNKVLHP